MSPALRANFDRLYHTEMVPHMNLLHNYALRLTSNEEDAKDLIQDTFMKAYRFIDKYQQDTNAKAWLFRILKNSFINNYRKSSRTPEQVEYSEVEEYVDLLKSDTAPSNDLRNEMFDHLLGDEIVCAMESLNEEFRTIIILSDLEEMTYEEIAEILEIPLGTVRSRLHRARKMMQDKLYGFAVHHGYITKKTDKRFSNGRTDPALQFASV